MQTANGLASFRNQRVLLLQGPAGPFFCRLARDLAAAGAQVHKINFNGGDAFFYSRNAIRFSGSVEQWPERFQETLASLNINVVMLYGDCRAYHRIACEIAQRHGIRVLVFEEGYLRPDHVTLEDGGVNGYSRLPKNVEFYRNLAPQEPEQATQLGNTFWHMFGWTVLYYLAASLLRKPYPHYRHHRPLVLREYMSWLRSLWRKNYYRVKERAAEKRLQGELAKRYFLVPLQAHNDFQIQVHSDFEEVESFIEHVVASFAQEAPPETVLVIKHHPMDRAYRNYAGLIAHLAHIHSLADRLLYVHDLHLPTLLRNARGVVVINSTVGLSALFHGTPVKVCGRAIYDLPGLSYQGSLRDFWKQAAYFSMDVDLYQGFRNHVARATQINGSFYCRLPDSGFETGMNWDRARIASAASPPSALPVGAPSGNALP
jgi:capsular polysaccharide export protein